MLDLTQLLGYKHVSITKYDKVRMNCSAEYFMTQNVNENESHVSVMRNIFYSHDK